MKYWIIFFQDFASVNNTNKHGGRHGFSVNISVNQCLKGDYNGREENR